jgi:gamma-glutamyltranspeptidase/glutathione hydrolase
VTPIALATPNPGAAAAGAAVADAGGNAVDVALAAIFAALVSEPGMASIGGGAYLTVAAPGAEPVTVDGWVAMPGRGLPPGFRPAPPDDLYLMYGGGTAMRVGVASVAVPGTLPAFETAHRRFGRIDWAAVVAPAADLARTGFPLGSAAAHWLSFSAEPLFGRDPAAAAVLAGPDGRPLGLGQTMRMPELGDFLDRVAAEGAAALTGGDVGAGLVRMMAETGGLVTGPDLAAYRPVVRPALRVGAGGWDWATNPAPAVGGPVVAALLSLLDTPTSVADLVAAQREVLGFRVRELDVAPDRVAAATRYLASLTPAPRGSASTVHVSCVDGDGLACAVTASSGYGSGVSVPGTGVWLNSCLGEPELNRRTLPPGQRLVSNMAPTVGRHPDGRVLAVGSPGADRIATAVAQVILALAEGLPLDAAVRRPRVHVTVRDDGAPLRLEHEADADLDGLAGPDAGLPRREHPELAMFFGGVGAALRRADGRFEAAADPRRDGAVLVDPR